MDDLVLRSPAHPLYRSSDVCYLFPCLVATSPVTPLKRIRLGNMGVTSNDILSRTESNATGLLFCISTRSSQGSSLIRLPRGRAGSWFMLRVPNCGAAAAGVTSRKWWLVHASG